MQKIKLFMAAATGEEIHGLEQTMNKWIEKEKAEIKNVSITIREISLGERESLTEELTDQLIVCLTYESK
jgi:hypothetical protein